MLNFCGEKKMNNTKELYLNYYIKDGRVEPCDEGYLTREEAIIALSEFEDFWIASSYEYKKTEVLKDDRVIAVINLKDEAQDEREDRLRIEDEDRRFGTDFTQQLKLFNTTRGV